MKELIILTNFFFHIYKHPYLIQDSIQRTIKTYDNPKYKNKNIFIAKSHEQKFVFNKHTVIRCPILLDKIRKRDNWIIINPETMNLYDIILYLYYAKRILTSYGAILYGHEIFFNPKLPKKDLIFLAKRKGMKPYNYIDRYTIIVYQDKESIVRRLLN